MSKFIQVTIKDIARELNISVATVSRALRDTHDVSAKTRLEVLKVAKELNYKANQHAIGLAGRKSHNIAVILPAITNYYFSAVVTGIQDIAYKSGYNIILFVTGESFEREIVIVENLPLSSIDGILICVTSESRQSFHLQKIIKAGFPIVFFDRAVDLENTSKVLQKDFEGAFMAVEHLILNGYKNIAHIGATRELVFTKERLKGYLAALKKYNISLRHDWIVHSSFNQLSGTLDTKKLWKGKNIPDAIFAVNDRKAVGAMLALKEYGIKIGEEVGVVGFTNDPMSAIISPSLTTIEEPAFEVGSQSCKLLLKHMSKRNIIPEEIILPGKLIIRESSKKK